MTYSLLDPNDWEAWQRQQQDSEALGTLLPPDSGLGGPPPMAAYQPPPHAEMAPLQLDTGPDWSDALGVGTTALASLADLALNHGRGTGQILAAGGQFGQARAEQRLRGTQDALAYEEKRAQLDKSNKYNDYLYANMAQRGQHQAVTTDQAGQRIDISRQNAGTKTTAEARQGAKVERDTNAQSDYADQFRNMLYDSGAVERGKYDGASYEQMKADQPAAGRMWEFQHAGDKAQATRGGMIAADLAAAPDTTAVAADRAGQEAAAREAVTGAGGRAQSAAARADEAAQQARYNKFRDETEKTRPQVGIAANLDKVLAKHPADAPGVGVWDSFKSGKLASDDDLAVRGAVSNMTDLVARVRSGAAIPPREFESIQRFVDGGTGASEQQFRVAYGAYKKTLQDEMRQQSQGRETEARSVLGQYGDWALGPMPKPVAAGPANFGPDAGHPSNLGVTGSVPKFRATPGGGAATARGDAVGPVGGMSSGSTGGGTLLLPSGRPAPGTLTPEQIQAVLAAGGHWQ